jgi:hypothetical protein
LEQTTTSKNVISAGKCKWQMAYQACHWPWPSLYRWHRRADDPLRSNISMVPWLSCHVGNQCKDIVAPVNKNDIIEIDPLLKHQMCTEDELKMQQQDIINDRMYCFCWHQSMHHKLSSFKWCAWVVLRRWHICNI